MAKTLLYVFLVVLAAPQAHAGSCMDALVSYWKQFQSYRNPPPWVRFEELKPYQPLLSQFQWDKKKERIRHTLGSDPFKYWVASLGQGAILELRFFSGAENLHWPVERSRAGQFTLYLTRTNAAITQAVFDELLALNLITREERTQLSEGLAEGHYIPNLDDEDRILNAQVLIGMSDKFVEIHFHDVKESQQVPQFYHHIEAVLTKIELAAQRFR